MTVYTWVTWNGVPFEPSDHDDYQSARRSVAEFVMFHASEQGMSSKRIAPDVWRIVGNGDTLEIRIAPVTLDDARTFSSEWFKHRELCPGCSVHCPDGYALERTATELYAIVAAQPV